VSVDDNIAEDINANTDTPEREVGTVTSTRVSRKGNRDINCDGYWENDPVKHTASESYFSNSLTMGGGADHGSSFGGYNELSTPITTQTRSIAKFALINYTRTAATEDVCTLTGTKYDIADGTQTSPGSETITLTKADHENGDLFWFPELFLGNSSATRLTLTQSSGYAVGLLHGSAFTNNGEMFRVTRVGWRAVIRSTIAIGDIDVVFYGIKTKGADATGGSWKQQIADLSISGSLMGGSNGDHLFNAQDVNVVFNDPNTDALIYPSDADPIGWEGIWAEWEFVSAPANGWQAMEIFFEYDTDFVLSDKVYE
jgi:hypothetical protein